MNVIQKIWALLFILICLTGCWDIRETENILYINSLGIDYKENKYHLYAQFINHINIAKQEGAATTEALPIFVGKGTGDNLYEAAFDLYRVSPQRLSWEHIKGIVLTENAIKKNNGLDKFDEFIARFFQVRNTIWIFGTKEENIEDLLSTRSILNISPVYSIINDPGDIFEQSSIAFPVQLYRFRSNIYEPAMHTYIPFVKINYQAWKEDSKDYELLTIDGAGFVTLREFKGHLSNEDLKGYPWTRKEMNRATLPLKVNGKPVAQAVLSDPKVKIKPVKKNGKILFQLNVKVDGNVYYLTKPYSKDVLREIAEKTVQSQIMTTYQKALEKGIDVYHLSQTLYRDQNDEWKKLEKNGVVPLDEKSLEVNVNINIKSGGREELIYQKKSKSQ